MMATMMMVMVIIMLLVMVNDDVDGVLHLVVVMVLVGRAEANDGQGQDNLEVKPSLVNIMF